MKITVPLIGLSWQDTKQNRMLRASLLMFAGVCLLTLSAKFKVPYYPVPMTLQTLVVLMLPFMVGAPTAMATVVAYLLLGVSGAPVFSGGGGIGYLTGPTGGFLIGFLPAVMLLSFGCKHNIAKRFGFTLVCVGVADLLIFTCGIAWLTYVVGDLDKALSLGFYPFIIGDMSKALLASALVVIIYKIQHDKKTKE